MGILLIQAAEMRLEGADVVLLNVRPEEVRKSPHVCRSAPACARVAANRLFCFRAPSVFCSGRFHRAPIAGEIDCFDGIETLPFSQRLVRLSIAAREKLPPT